MEPTSETASGPCDAAAAPPVPAHSGAANGLEPLYNALVSLRNTELSVYYTRYNIQAVINLGLIAAVLATRSDSTFLSPLPVWVVVGGVVLSLIWLGFAVVGKRLFTERWEDYLRRYELEILAPKNLRRDLQTFTHVADLEKGLGWWKKHWSNLNILARSVPILALAAWMLIAWSSWYAKPLNARMSQLEPNLAELQESSRLVSQRLSAIERDIREVREALTRLPTSGPTGVRKAPLPRVAPKSAQPR